jgi:cysteinyl-tRNA synthetase
VPGDLGASNFEADGSLTEECESLVRELTDLLNGTSVRIQTLENELQAHQQFIQRSIDSQDDHVNRLAALLAELSAQIEQTAGELLTESSLMASVQAAVSNIAQDANDVAGPLTSVSGVVLDHIHSSGVAAKETVETLVQQIDEQLHASVLKVGTELHEFISDTLVSQIHMVRDQLGHSIGDHANNILDPFVSKILHAVDQIVTKLVKKIIDSSHSTRSENASLRPVMEALRLAIDELLKEFKRVADLNPL